MANHSKKKDPASSTPSRLIVTGSNPQDEWTTKEKLVLASSVLSSGDQNWVSVSRVMKQHPECAHPSDWYSQKNCAIQYNRLLEIFEKSKRKRGEPETSGQYIVRMLSNACEQEVAKRGLTKDREDLLKLQKDIEELKTCDESRLDELAQDTEYEEFMASEEGKKLLLTLTEEDLREMAGNEEIPQDLVEILKNTSRNANNEEGSCKSDHPASVMTSELKHVAGSTITVINDETTEIADCGSGSGTANLLAILGQPPKVEGESSNAFLCAQQVIPPSQINKICDDIISLSAGDNEGKPSSQESQSEDDSELSINKKSFDSDTIVELIKPDIFAIVPRVLLEGDSSGVSQSEDDTRSPPKKMNVSESNLSKKHDVHVSNKGDMTVSLCNSELEEIVEDMETDSSILIDEGVLHVSGETYRRSESLKHDVTIGTSAPSSEEYQASNLVSDKSASDGSDSDIQIIQSDFNDILPTVVKLCEKGTTCIGIEEINGKENCVNMDINSQDKSRSLDDTAEFKTPEKAIDHKHGEVDTKASPVVQECDLDRCVENGTLKEEIEISKNKSNSKVSTFHSSPSKSLLLSQSQEPDSKNVPVKLDREGCARQKTRPKKLSGSEKDDFLLFNAKERITRLKAGMSNEYLSTESTSEVETNVETEETIVDTKDSEFVILEKQSSMPENKEEIKEGMLQLDTVLLGNLTGGKQSIEFMNYAIDSTRPTLQTRLDSTRPTIQTRSDLNSIDLPNVKDKPSERPIKSKDALLESLQTMNDTSLEKIPVLEDTPPGSLIVLKNTPAPSVAHPINTTVIESNPGFPGNEPNTLASASIVLTDRVNEGTLNQTNVTITLEGEHLKPSRVTRQSSPIKSPEKLKVKEVEEEVTSEAEDTPGFQKRRTRRRESRLKHLTDEAHVLFGDFDISEGEGEDKRVTRARAKTGTPTPTIAGNPMKTIVPTTVTEPDSDIEATTSRTTRKRARQTSNSVGTLSMSTQDLGNSNSLRRIKQDEDDKKRDTRKALIRLHQKFSDEAPDEIVCEALTTLTVAKLPMNLMTIKKRIQTAAYPSIHQLERDTSLMFLNFEMCYYRSLSDEDVKLSREFMVTCFRLIEEFKNEQNSLISSTANVMAPVPFTAPKVSESSKKGLRGRRPGTSLKLLQLDSSNQSEPGEGDDEYQEEPKTRTTVISNGKKKRPIVSEIQKSEEVLTKKLRGRPPLAREQAKGRISRHSTI